MSRNYLGEFEEIVLLTVAAMEGEAYGALLLDNIAVYTGREAQLSAIHVALYRLEEKKLVTSRLGGATAERGGRRKRLFTITAEGMQILRDIRAVREELWQLIRG
ncbi:MAG: PadR family transcriptional regulator [Citrobacter freundii]|nr:MAG: PadR family transcriptional regulator [Citrobacter freundii]